MELKRIGPLSLAKIYGLIGVAVGLITGIIYAGFGPQIKAQALAQGVQVSALVDLGVAAIIAAPIGYGIGFFIVGGIAAWLYNLLAKWIGGVELELSK